MEALQCTTRVATPLVNASCKNRVHTPHAPPIVPTPPTPPTPPQKKDGGVRVGVGGGCRCCCMADKKKPRDLFSLCEMNLPEVDSLPSLFGLEPEQKLLQGSCSCQAGLTVTGEVSDACLHICFLAVKTDVQSGSQIQILKKGSHTR